MAGIGVLLTRTQPGTMQSARRLEQMGYRPLINPVLEVRPTAQKPPSLSGVQAIIASSANGISFLPMLNGAYDLPLFCLDGASLEKASALGMVGKIHTCDGDGEALARLVQEQISPEDGPLLWVHGRHIAFDIDMLLIQSGYQVHDWVAYETHPVSKLGDKTIKALRHKEIQVALFHSARGAKNFASLVRKQRIPAEHVTAIGISKKACEPLMGAAFSRVIYASVPNETSLLETLQQNCPPV